MGNEAKVYEVVVSDDATHMLGKHVRFLANVNVPAARRLRVTLYDAFVSLKKMPHRCPVFHTRRTDETYRHLIIGRYQIIFSIDEEADIVNIEYILDSRQESDF